MENIINAEMVVFVKMIVAGLVLSLVSCLLFVFTCDINNDNNRWVKIAAITLLVGGSLFTIGSIGAIICY